MLALTLILAAAPAAAQVSWGAVPSGYPRTASELDSFSRHTRHLEMWDYLEELSTVAHNMRLGTYGETREGRSLPYAVFSNPTIAEPWEAWALDRPIVVLSANVHGDERTFREGLLILMRDFATPGTEAYELLDEVTVVVTPQINPDGFEADDDEDGQRGNAWGTDLNRDYVKLEHPAIIHYIGDIIGEWRPHLYVDGHNGGSRPYNLAYLCPTHAEPAADIALLCDRQIFPYIDQRLESEGLKSWYYTSGNEEEWRVGGWQARIGRNYGGFVNSVAILFEAPSQRLEVGARAGYLGYLAVVDWAAQNAQELMTTVHEARMETIAMGAEPRGDVVIEMEYTAEDYTVDYEIVRESESGEEEIVQVTDARIMKKPVVLKTRPRPWAYVLPRDAVDAVAMLRRHGITVLVTTQETDVEVDAYTVAGVTHEEAYNHEAATVIEVGDVVTRTMEFPEGTYVVPTSQFLGRLVTHMLEPETEDNVIYWNTMDAWIPRTPERDRVDGEVVERPPLVPIYKIMQPTELPTIMVEAIN